MPRIGRANIGRKSQHAQNEQARRQHSQENENIRNLNVRSRAQESGEQRSQRLEADRLRHRQARQRLTNENRGLHLLAERQRIQVRRALIAASFNRLAFEYDLEIEYSPHSKLIIGDMNKVCQFCHALKFKNETPGMCCAA